jgi:RimJ/RimL family protein N-acetyltransferase
MSLADIDRMTGLLGDPQVMWVYPEPFSRERVREWIDWNGRGYRERGFGLWIVSLRDTGEFVGECGLTPQTFEGITEIEVGYHVRHDLWGRGYATEAVTAARDFARDEARLPRIVALIDPRNAASQRVATKSGLRYERDVTVPTKTLRVYGIDFDGSPGPRPSSAPDQGSA